MASYSEPPKSIRVGDGTAAAPGIAFESDPDTGLYRDGENRLCFSSGGVGIVAITPTDIRPLGATNVRHLGAADGTAAFRNVWMGNVLAQTGVGVVGPRGAAVADAAGGAMVDLEARAALNTLLTRLRAHGLIAP